jgi:hypothetical protein
LLLLGTAQAQHLVARLAVGLPRLGQRSGQGLVLIGCGESLVRLPLRVDNLDRIVELLFVLALIAAVGGAAVLDLELAGLDDGCPGARQLAHSREPLDVQLVGTVVKA